MKFKGYSLIEVLVVITIIGVLFSVGYANYRSFSRRQTLMGIAKQIEGDMRLAQQMALSGEKPPGSYPVGCDNRVLDSVRFGISKTAPINYKIRAVCGEDATDNYPIIKTFFLPEGFSYNISTFAPNPIHFKVLGQGTNIPSGSNGTLTINDAFGNYATITVDSGGSINLR